MKELDQYTMTLASSQEQSPITMMPLKSWDIHMSSFSKERNKHKDATELSKLLDKLTIDADPIGALLEKNAKVVVVTRPSLLIEYASSNLVEMSGYLPEEVIGNSPKMFQGPKTNREIAKQIRYNVEQKVPFEAVLTNYKKDKSTYSCVIKGYPAFNKYGELIRYVAIEYAA